MDFDQGGQAQAEGAGVQVGEVGVIGQGGGDQQDGVCAVGAGFVDLGFVDGEVFS